MSQNDVRFEPPLTAYQMVASSVVSLRHSDGLLEAEPGDTRHQLPEEALVTRAGVEHRNVLDRDQLNFGVVRHAAVLTFVRALSSKNGANVSKR